MKWLTLRRLNNVLSLIVVVLALYLLLAPFWPKAAFELKEDPPLAKDNSSTPSKNTLVIPKMKLQEAIHDGPDEGVLNKGVWHRPSSTPENGGNTVLTGHRFTYGGPAVFYHMDKIDVGDEVIVYWDQKKYAYQVEDVAVVPPSAREIEDQTEEPLLTIYTCTPLITATNRLVIKARPVGGEDGS